MHVLIPLTLTAALAGTLVATCGPREPLELVVTPEVAVLAERYVETSGPVDVLPADGEGVTVRPRASEGWLGYEIEVPATGRYRCEVRVAAEPAGDGDATLWIEDYVGNPDGRTYDITGPVRLGPTRGFTTVTRVGSPLAAGRHPVRVHFAGARVRLAWLRFTLVAAHVDTPRTLEQETDGDEWTLVWSDEFDGEGLPDPEKWTHDLGDWGWGNREPQFYTAGRTENARQEDGNLVIEARRNDQGHRWTSARLTTRGKVTFQYGRFEIRAKVPAGDGTWAAGWLLGDAYRDEVSWPYCGEIDVLEGVGREIDDESGDGVNHASCHTRAYYFKQGNHISSTTRVEDMSGEFHVYAVEWTPESVRVFLDGEHYYTYDEKGVYDDGGRDLAWPFDAPQNLILNLAMGGGMGGPIDPALESQRFVVDYVRVFGRP